MTETQTETQTEAPAETQTESPSGTLSETVDHATEDHPDSTATAAAVTVESAPAVTVESAPEVTAEAPSPASGSGDEDPVEVDSDEVDSDDDKSADGKDAGSAPENPLETEAEVAADYLEELLDIADLDGDIDTYIEGDRAHVSVVADSDVLVGAKGEVLDALQELARLAVLAETGERSRLMLDVAGFRDKRRTELVALASEAIEEVKAKGEPVSLTAMNPFERKIVHDAVAAAGLTSASEGEEPRRRVVVQPA